MKFAVVLSLAACALAMPGTPVKRDGASISSAIGVVAASVTALDNAVNAYSGAGDTASLQAASDAVIAATNAGTQVADASAPLSDLEAIGLVNPINALVAIVNTTVTDAINKKPTFDAAGASPAVLTSLQNQRSAAIAFQTAVVNKLSDNTKSTGQSLSQPIIDSLDQGIAAFSAPGGGGTTTTPPGGVTTTPPPVTTTTPSVVTTTPVPPPTTTGKPPPTTTGKPPPTTTGKPPPPPPTTTKPPPPPPTTTGKPYQPTTMKTTTKGYGGGWGQWGGWDHDHKTKQWGDWNHGGNWGHWEHKPTTTKAWGHWN